MVSAYDVIIKSCVASYVELSFSIDAEVFKQATMVSDAPCLESFNLIYFAYN